MMIYRFLSKLATLDRLQAFPLPIPDSNIVSFYMPKPKAYEEKLALIEQNPAMPNVGVFVAPRYGEYDGITRTMYLRFHAGCEGAKLPDIWCTQSRIVVSEKVKKIFESHDTLEHEYFPIQWVDHTLKPIVTAQTYFWMNQRRYLRITPCSRIAKPRELGFFPVEREEDFLARVLDEPVLADWLTRFPVWQHIGIEGNEHRLNPSLCVLYFNDVMFNTILDNEAAGAEFYSVKYGAGEESICSFGQKIH